MPKTPRKRNYYGRRRFAIIKFRNEQALSTLASDALLTITLTGLAQDFYCQSVDTLWALRDGTVDEGPISVGFANGDLSVTEIVESLDANPISQSDIIAQERTRRPVRYAGQFPSGEQGGSDLVLNDGKMMRTKLGIMLNEGVELVGWIRNETGAVLAGGAVVECRGKIYGYWK